MSVDIVSIVSQSTWYFTFFSDEEEILTESGCFLSTEKRNFTIDDCTVHNINLSYCKGNCRSAVHVISSVSTL